MAVCILYGIVVSRTELTVVKSPLLRIFLVSWLLSFLSFLFSMFLLAWIEGPESVRVAVFAAPFWAAILSPVAAVICTLLYRVCRKGRNITFPQPTRNESLHEVFPV